MAGSSGGGGGVGSAVPNYLRNVHSDILAWVENELPRDHPTSSMVAVLNEVLVDNPFKNAHPRSPLTSISEIDTLLNAYRTWIETLDTQDYSDQLKVFSDGAVKDLEETVLPKLKADYRDVGATYSTTYYIASAKLYAAILSDQDKLRAELVLNASKTKAGVYADLYRMWLEAVRMKAVMLDEEQKQELSYREHSAKWRLEAFMPVGNFISSVSGGTVPLNPKQPSAFSNALGGALSGAATGAMLGASMPVGGPITPAIGAMAGGAIGLLGGLFG